MSDPSYSCRQIVELVTDYLEGALPGEERLGFERHVVICPPCRAYFAQLAKIRSSAGGLREEELPESLREGLLEAFRDWKAAK